MRGLEVERKKKLRHFRDLEVYRREFDAAMEIYQMTKNIHLLIRFDGHLALFAQTWQRVGEKGVILLCSRTK